MEGLVEYLKKCKYVTDQTENEVFANTIERCEEPTKTIVNIKSFTKEVRHADDIDHFTKEEMKEEQDKPYFEPDILPDKDATFQGDVEVRQETKTTTFIVPKNEIMNFWNVKQDIEEKRSFRRENVQLYWPQMYKSPCNVSLVYNHVRKLGSRKRSVSFGLVRGKCLICDASHEYLIEDSPFEEIVNHTGEVTYESIEDMFVSVVVSGQFLVQNGDTFLSLPYHLRKKSHGHCLTGEERLLLSSKVSQEGAQHVYNEQFASQHKHQIEMGNRTPYRSLDVLKQAGKEFEKQYHCGRSFIESIHNIKGSQKEDISTNFKRTEASLSIPGFIRRIQEDPFNLMMANYDQLKIGAEYLNKWKDAELYLDSSGKIWKEPKTKHLNTALVMPPHTSGQSSFPIFEQVSKSNKTIDFSIFLRYAWHFLSTSINNKSVKYPSVIVSDLSFPNIHSILEFFNKTVIADYLVTTFDVYCSKITLPYQTKLTICENHLLPAMLKFSRTHCQNKIIADTMVANLMLLLRAKDMNESMKIWKNVVKVFCSKTEDVKARQSIREFSYGDDHPDIETEDFGDDDDPQDDSKFGSRTSIRANSPFFNLFMTDIKKITSIEDQDTRVTNVFYCPKSLEALCKQYLSLYPLFAASFLNSPLKSNAHIENYWKYEKTLIRTVPDRLLWPPIYLGTLHNRLKLRVSEMVVEKSNPNIRHGGKWKPKCSFLDSVDIDEKFNKPKFHPKHGKQGKQDESLEGSKENWSSPRGEPVKGREIFIIVYLNTKQKKLSYAQLRFSPVTRTKGGWTKFKHIGTF